MSLFWIQVGILLIEASFGLLAKGAIAVAILRLIFVHKKLNPSSIYMLDKTVGDFIYLITWAIPTILEHEMTSSPHGGIDNQSDSTSLDMNNTMSGIKPSPSKICPTSYLFPVKILNMITFIHSVAILTFMSVQRNMCITKPLYVMVNSKISSAIIHVTVLWCVAATVGCSIQSCYTFVMCHIDKPYPVLLQVTFTVCTYLVPVIVIFNSYFSAVITLQRSTSRETMIHNQVQIFKRKNLAKKMLCLVIIFGFCWIGYNVVLLTRFAMMDEDDQPLQWAMFVANVIALSNFTLNPLAIIVLNSTIMENLTCFSKNKIFRQRMCTVESVAQLRSDAMVNLAENGINCFRKESFETLRTDLLED